MRKVFFRILLVNPLEISQEQLDKLFQIPLDVVAITHLDIPLAKEKLKKLILPSGKRKIFLNPAKLLKEGFGSIGSSIAPTKTGSIEPGVAPTKSGPIEPDEESILNTEEILEMVGKKFQLLGEKEPLLIDRHCQLIKSISYNFNNLWKIWEKSRDIGIISSELDILGQEVAELVGIVSLDDVLDYVFANFCIGK